MTKQQAIAETVVNSANATTGLMKQMSKRKIFIKKYNRRPRNKQKRSLIMPQTALEIFSSAAQIAMIRQQPVPKFNDGAISGMIVPASGMNDELIEKIKQCKQ